MSAHIGSERRVYSSTRRMLTISEPIWEVHGEAFAASRLSIMGIMARRMNAVTVDGYDCSLATQELAFAAMVWRLILSLCSRIIWPRPQYTSAGVRL